MTAVLAEFDWAASKTPPPVTPPPSQPAREPRAPTHPQPSRPDRTAPPPTKPARSLSKPPPADRPSRSPVPDPKPTQPGPRPSGPARTHPSPSGPNPRPGVNPGVRVACGIHTTKTAAAALSARAAEAASETVSRSVVRAPAVGAPTDLATAGAPALPTYSLPSAPPQGGTVPSSPRSAGAISAPGGAAAEGRHPVRSDHLTGQRDGGRADLLPPGCLAEGSGRRAGAPRFLPRDGE